MTTLREETQLLLEKLAGLYDNIGPDYGTATYGRRQQTGAMVDKADKEMRLARQRGDADGMSYAKSLYQNADQRIKQENATVNKLQQGKRMPVDAAARIHATNKELRRANTGIKRR